MIVKVADNTLGTFYALKNKKAKSAFLNPMQSCRAVRLCKADAVVDIGAYIGEYSMYASLFTENVTAYEASPATFSILKANARRGMKVFNKAVIGDSNKPKAKLFISKGLGATNSIVKHKGLFTSVDAVSYNEAVANASVVKIDVEGAEYDYKLFPMSSKLRAVILEFHPIADMNWLEKANQIKNQLRATGFSCVKDCHFKNGWDTNTAWVRQ
jgi:FkbM family methyltransferase